MRLIAFILNLPWTILALLAGIISLPQRIGSRISPWALVISVRSFWWLEYFPGHKGVRAATLGNVVLIGPKSLTGDIEHKLVHVEQHQREPFVHPFLYLYESVRHGYRQNKYETEAYERAGNVYLEK